MNNLKYIGLLSLCVLVLFWLGGGFKSTWAADKHEQYTYRFIYTKKINKVNISPKTWHKIQCLEDIFDVSVDPKIMPELEFRGRILNFKIESLPQKVDLMIKTLQRTYDVRLIPDEDAGPMALIARQEDHFGDEYLSAEKLNKVLISNKGIILVRCDDPSIKIKTIILPRNSFMEKVTDGANAYLRYTGKDPDPDPVVVHINTESGQVYSAELTPADVDAKPLTLKDSKGSASLADLYGNRHEELVIRLIKSAIVNPYKLNQAKISEKDEKITTIEEIDITEHAQYQFERDGITLVEYHLTLRSGEQNILFDEKYLYQAFLKPMEGHGKHIMGLALDRDHLIPEQKSRLFVVIRNSAK